MGPSDARIAIAIHHLDTGDSCAIPQLQRALEAFETTGPAVGGRHAAFWLARELCLHETRSREEAALVVEEGFELAKQANEPLLITWFLIWSSKFGSPTALPASG
jgi:hypothetical protein